jgi:hypothetical protein
MCTSNYLKGVYPIEQGRTSCTSSSSYGDLSPHWSTISSFIPHHSEKRVEKVDSFLRERLIYRILRFSCRLQSMGRGRSGTYFFSIHLDVHDSKLQIQRNLLLKSLDLFRSVINSPWFSRTSIILFLTGIHAFKVKLTRVRYNLIQVLHCVTLSAH